MTPELTLLLVGAIVGLLGALTYSWRAYSDVQKLRADAEHVKAQTAKQDNDNMSQLIAYTGRLTIAIDNISGALHGVQSASDAQTAILTALVDETKATRADLKAWPELVSLEIKGMRGQVGRVEQSVALLIGAAEQQREEALAVKEALLTMTGAIDKLVQHVQDAESAAPAA